MWYLVQTILYAEGTRWGREWGGWGSRVRSFVGFILYTSYIRLWNDMQNKPAQYACKLIVCHQWMMCLHSTFTACLNRMIQISGTDASERCVHVRLCGADTESRSCGVRVGALLFLRKIVNEMWCICLFSRDTRDREVSEEARMPSFAEAAWVHAIYERVNSPMHTYDVISCAVCFFAVNDDGDGGGGGVDAIRADAFSNAKHFLRH